MRMNRNTEREHAAKKVNQAFRRTCGAHSIAEYLTSRARLADLSRRKRLIIWKISPLWMGRPSPIQRRKADATESPLDNFSILQLRLFASPSFDSFRVPSGVSAGATAASSDVWVQNLRMRQRLVGQKHGMLSDRRIARKAVCS